MSDSSWQDELKPLIRTEQIIVGALIAGAVLFLVVAAVVASQGVSDMGEDESMSLVFNLVLLLFLMSAVLGRLIVPASMVAAARRKIVSGNWSPAEGPNQADLASIIARTGDAGRLIAVHQTKTIVGAALVEGVTFFAIIVYMLTQSTFGLAVACAMIAVQALLFPTRGRVLDWIEAQLRRIEEERAFAGPGARTDA